MINFVRKFLPDLSSVLAPLVDLTKKEHVKSIAKRWRNEHDEAFATVKRLLTEAPILHFPDFTKDFVVHVDASEAGAGAFLAQQTGTDLNIVAYFSQRFNNQCSAPLFPNNERMLRSRTSNTALAALFMGQTF